MYQFSQNAFVNLYEKTLSSSSGGKTETRVDGLKRSFLHVVFEYVSKSLFKEDRLMFAMHVVHGMFPEIFLPNEWEHLTGMLVDSSSSSQNDSWKFYTKTRKRELGNIREHESWEIKEKHESWKILGK